MGALNDYIAQCRDLLHDPNGQFWSNTDLTRYINEARNRVCQDSKCLRSLVTGVILTAAQEVYVWSTYLNTPAGIGARVVDVQGITVYWGTTRRKLFYLPFSKFDAQYRYWQGLTSLPEAFARMGQVGVYIGPTPDQAYVSDWDCALNPTPLVSDATVDEVPIPFQEPVQFYAAYKAKFKEQSLGESQIFKTEYKEKLVWCARAAQTYIQPNAYAS